MFCLLFGINFPALVKTQQIIRLSLDNADAVPRLLTLTWNKLLLLPNSLLTFNKMLNTKLILEGSNAIYELGILCQSVLCELTKLFPVFVATRFLFSRLGIRIVLSGKHAEVTDNVPAACSLFNTGSDCLAFCDGQGP